MRSLKTILLALWLLVTGCFAAEQVASVSLIQLIANAEKYDDHEVVVTAYVKMGEHPTLYLHKEDWTNAIDVNTIWIEPSEDMWHHRNEVDGKYVQIRGVFRAGRSNRSGGGGIAVVKAYKVWSDPLHPYSG